MTLFLQPLQPVIIMLMNLMMRFQESRPRQADKWSNRGREIKFSDKENTRPSSWRHALQSLVVTLPVRAPTASADSTDSGYWITCKFCPCLLPIITLKSVVKTRKSVHPRLIEMDTDAERKLRDENETPNSVFMARLDVYLCRETP
jgi:hypothetical protein